MTAIFILPLLLDLEPTYKGLKQFRGRRNWKRVLDLEPTYKGLKFQD